MNDHYKALDETISAIRADCEAQLQAMRDKLLAAEIEATMAKDGLKAAREAEAAAQRVTTKLLTQFGLVAQVFDEARKIAMDLQRPVLDEEALRAMGFKPEPGGVINVKNPSMATVLTQNEIKLEEAANDPR